MTDTQGEHHHGAAIRRDDWFLSWLPIAFGVTIIGCHIESGAARWSSAAWQYATRIPGSPATWGIIILLSGALLIVGNTHRATALITIGYLLAFAWFCVLASATALAVYHDLQTGMRQANPLAVVGWLAFAYLYESRISDRRSRSRR